MFYVLFLIFCCIYHVFLLLGVPSNKLVHLLVHYSRGKYDSSFSLWQHVRYTPRKVKFHTNYTFNVELRVLMFSIVICRLIDYYKIQVIS